MHYPSRLPSSTRSMFVIRRHALAALVFPAFAMASPNVALDALETAPSLDQLVQILQASAALASSHLLLDAPDVAAPGKVRVRLRSDLPGSSLLILAKGAFKPQAQGAPGSLSPPPQLSSRRTLGEVTPSERLPRPVWLGSFPIKAGKPAQASLNVELDRTQTLSLFVHAQGRWWFVSREVKIGRPAAPAGSATKGTKDIPARSPSSAPSRS